MKFSNKSKKIAITGMVAIVLILGGMILTSPMLDNSDPITSGEYMVGETGPEWDPFPEVKVDPESTPDTVEKLERIANVTVEAGKELISEVSKEFGDTGKNKNVAKKGGFGLGTLFMLYLGYRFIFK